MPKRFLYWGRYLLVAHLVFFMVVHPAWAGRGFRGWLRQHCFSVSHCCQTSGWQPVTCQPATCQPVVCPPVVCQPCCNVPIDCCHLSSMAESPQQLSVEGEQVADPSSPHDGHQEAPLAVTSTDVPQESSPSDALSDADAAAVVPLEQPPADPVAEAPAADEGTPDEPAAEEPVVEEPTDQDLQLPEDPQLEEPVPPTADDIFGLDDQAPAPAESPLDDSLFGDDPFSPTESSDELMTDDLDDIFGAPDAPEDSRLDDDLYGAPADDLDDIFGIPQSESHDDIFSGEPVSLGDADDELFGEEKLFGNDDLLDHDIFGTPDEARGSREDPFDLFDFNTYRTWQDNTGTFQIEARLVELHAGHAKLLKANGNFCTVPLRRFSQSDFELLTKVAQHFQSVSVVFVAAGRAPAADAQ